MVAFDVAVDLVRNALPVDRSLKTTGWYSGWMPGFIPRRIPFLKMDVIFRSPHGQEVQDRPQRATPRHRRPLRLTPRRTEGNPPIPPLHPRPTRSRLPRTP